MIVIRHGHHEALRQSDDLYAFDDDLLHVGAPTSDFALRFYVATHFWFELRVCLTDLRHDCVYSTQSLLGGAIHFSFCYTFHKGELRVDRTMQLLVVDRARFSLERERVLAAERHRVVAMVGDVYVGRAQHVASDASLSRVYSWSSGEASSAFGLAARGECDWERHAQDAADLRAIRGGARTDPLLSARRVEPTVECDHNGYHNDHCVLPVTTAMPVRLQWFNLIAQPAPFAECVIRQSTFEAHQRSASRGSGRRRASSSSCVTEAPAFVTVTLTDALEARIEFSLESGGNVRLHGIELRARHYRSSLVVMGMESAMKSV